MASTYVNDLRLEEMATGDQSGTWGDTTNTNLELIAEAFSYGTEASFGSDADATTTIADGASDPARSLYLKITSGVSLTATRTLTIAPNTVSKVWIIENATSGSQSINISQGSGANVTIPNGDVKVIYTDGAGSGAAVVDAFTDLNLSGTTTVAALDAGSGAITTTGTVTGNTLAGTLSTAAQPNITSVGTLTGFTSTGIDDNATSTAITIDSNENLGIGTASPVNNGAGSQGLTINGTGNYQNLNLQVGGTTQFTIYTNGTSGTFINQATADPMMFHTSDTERMRIDSSGNVGINNTECSHKLHVEENGTGAITSIRVANENTSVGDGSQILFTSGTSTVGAAIASYGTALNEASLLFKAGGDTERMRIDSSGNVGIDTTDTGNAKLVINGTTAAGDVACIDFDGFGSRGDGFSQSINFRMGRPGQATDQPAQIKSYFQGGGATAGQTAMGFKFITISANTQIEQFFIDAAYARFKFNSTENPQSNNPQTSACFVIGPSGSTAVTSGLTNSCVLINRGGELFAVDSSHNNTQLTPHNWTLIPEGPSEELAWTYWSQRPNPDNPDQLQGINVDMAKVARKVEDLVGEKLVYTENSNMDNHTHQNIIADIQSTLANLTTRIEALEA